MAELTYKVLIADDEYWTREKIRTMIDWKQYHLEFLEPAVDGEDVINKIKENMPDILITDINMPFINGLDLVKQLKKEYPNIVVFVISGYDDFEYVKAALLEGAINYLLKPVTKMDLVNTLSKALEIISNREQMKKEKEEQIIQTRKEASFLQDSEFSLFVETEEIAYTPTIMMNSNIIAGCSMILIKIHNMHELVSIYNYDMNKLSYSLKKEIKNLTGYENLLIFNYIFRSNEFIIISELENQKLLEMARTILSYFKGRTSTPVSIIVSEHSYSIESIHAAYIQCVSMLMLRSYNKESAIIFCDKNNPDMKAIIKNPVTEELEKGIKSLIKSGNQAALKKMIFETIGLRNCEYEKWSLLEVKQTVKKICHLFLDVMAEGQSSAEIMDMENMVDLAGKTVENLMVDNICEILEEMIDLTIDLQKEDMSGSIKHVVKHVVNYIDNNFFENLTLTSLSKRFNVESSYFSKIFRQETGENLTSYIAKRRIEKAKEYMLDSSINLTEIAFMVGYDDYTYFNRVFRKMAGVSPRDYRNEREAGGK